MSGLYPNYRPRGVKSDWDHVSMTTDGSGELFRARGIPASYGDPIECVAWFDNANEALRCVVADYPNGKRVTYRLSGRTWTLDIQQLAARTALQSKTGEVK